MAEKIEVYVKKGKKLVGEHFTAPMSDGIMTHSCLPHGEMLEYEKALPEVDKKALELVIEFADDKGLQVKVIDTSTIKGKLRAATRGINKTPAVTIGQERIDAPFNMDRLKEKLESHFKGARA